MPTELYNSLSDKSVLNGRSLSASRSKQYSDLDLSLQLYPIVRKQGIRAVQAVQSIQQITAVQQAANTQFSKTLEIFIVTSGVLDLTLPFFLPARIGGILYSINNVEKPILTLVRGYRYEINVTAPGFPLYIQTTFGNFNSNNVYNVGVSGNGTNLIRFEIPLNAPNELYYVSSALGSMGNLIQIVDQIQGVQGIQGVTAVKGKDQELGDVIPLLDIDAVKTAIKNLILTNYDERLFRPKLGSNLRNFLFEPANRLTRVAITESIKSVIAQYEPRVDSVVVNVKDDSDRNRYHVQLSFRIINIDTEADFSIYLIRLR